MFIKSKTCDCYTKDVEHVHFVKNIFAKLSEWREAEDSLWKEFPITFKVNEKETVFLRARDWVTEVTLFLKLSKIAINPFLLTFLCKVNFYIAPPLCL